MQTDDKSMDWVRGNSWISSKSSGELDLHDAFYLLEHLFLNILNLKLNHNSLGGAFPEMCGEEQAVNWRMINLLCINSELITREEAREKYEEICEVHGVENESEIVGLFNQYIA